MRPIFPPTPGYVERVDAQGNHYLEKLSSTEQPAISQGIIDFIESQMDALALIKAMLGVEE